MDAQIIEKTESQTAGSVVKDPADIKIVFSSQFLMRGGDKLREEIFNFLRVHGLSTAADPIEDLIFLHMLIWKRSQGICGWFGAWSGNL